MSFEGLREELSRVLEPPPNRAVVEGTHAAVLMGISDFPEGPRLWLIRRPETMRKHGGQVAFPGGKFEAGDASLVETALREAEEEVGLPRELVTVLGALDELTIRFSGYVVTPVVAWIAPGFEPRPNEVEVARVFTIAVEDVAFAFDEVSPLVGVQLEGERLWGASAFMVKRLGEAIRRARGR